MDESNANSSERMLYGTLLVLTFVSGLIDAASFLSLGHVFTANMTGNIVFMAFARAGVPGLSLLRYAVALVTALAGGVLAGYLDSRLKWQKRTSWLSVACAIEATAVAAAAIVAWTGRAGSAEPGIVYAIIGLIGFGMGVRNGTIRRLAVPDLTTTVLTFTVLGLAFDSSIAGGLNTRWRTRLASILMMFLGALSGALISRYSLALLLGLSAFLVACCAILQPFRGETAHERKLKAS